jgi:hypothetical protein
VERFREAYIRGCRQTRTTVDETGADKSKRAFFNEQILLEETDGAN